MNSVFEVLPMMMVMAIPIVAIIGGITVGIVRSVNRQRMIELAQKERIAAIERGLDPAQIQPIEFPPGMFGDKNGLTFEQKQERRSQLLMVWGLITTSFGLALTIMLAIMENDRGAWAGGMIFLMGGMALMLSARVVRPPNLKSPSTRTDPEI